MPCSSRKVPFLSGWRESDRRGPLVTWEAVPVTVRRRKVVGSVGGTGSGCWMLCFARPSREEGRARFTRERLPTRRDRPLRSGPCGARKRPSEGRPE